MCNEQAGSPGNLILIDLEYSKPLPFAVLFRILRKLEFQLIINKGNYTSFLANQSEFDGDFNPHGFSRDPNGNVIVTNFILPSTLLAPNVSDLVFRDYVMAVSSSGHLKVFISFVWRG